MNETVAFIGAGNMARSLIAGLLAAGADASRIRASDPSPEQRDRLASLGVPVFADNGRATSGATVVVLAVKPQAMQEVAQNLRLDGRPLIISIAAGIPLTALRRWLPPETALVRCMPNTPALLGAGITGLYGEPGLSAEHRAAADGILRAAGTTVWVPREDLLDAVTALSGSGPAYFFYLMEAMVEAGTAMGLDPETARLLTLETAYGAARMAREGDDPPETLRVNVTSPGGTTERALTILDAAGTRGVLERAIAGAAERARELAEGFGRP